MGTYSLKITFLFPCLPETGAVQVFAYRRKPYLLCYSKEIDVCLSVAQVGSPMRTFPVTNSISVVKLLSKLFLRCGSNIKYKLGIVFCRSSPVTKRLLTRANLMLFLNVNFCRVCKNVCLGYISENQRPEYFLRKQGL